MRIKEEKTIVLFQGRKNPENFENQRLGAL